MPRVTAAVLKRSSCRRIGSAAKGRRSVALDIGGELADRLAARALAAVHIQRQADYQRPHFVLAREVRPEP